ncbi:MAG: GrpB family protein, partial [Thermoplasmata archaeon]
IGSTSVEDLAAKPVIDMDIVVASEADIGPAIESLGRIGYRWRGDLGVEGREAFTAPEGLDLPRHHLYLVVEDNNAHIDHWLLRDILRTDPDARRRYGELKGRNVEVARGDMDVYVAAKARFVADLLTRGREERGLPAAEYWEPDLDPGNPG